MALLAMLTEQPMHTYRMHELIKQRGKNTVVNVAQRNSVYQTIERLLRVGLIHVEQTTQTEGRPERVIYGITQEGRDTLHTWLAEMLTTPVNEYPAFPAALAFVMVLSPAKVQRELAARCDALSQSLTVSQQATEALMKQGLPRLFLIEDEYKQAMQRAELTWVQSLLDDMQHGRIDWNEAWLKDVAATFEGGT